MLPGETPRNTPTPGVTLVAEVLDALASRTATAEIASGRATAGNAASQAILITWAHPNKIAGCNVSIQSLKKIMFFFWFASACFELEKLNEFAQLSKVGDLLESF